jgi:hypothetical protein
VHAHPRHELGQVEHHVALAEAVPEHRDRPQLERARPEEDEVRVDPVQLAEQHPHPRRLGWNVDLEQLLDREHEDELVVLEGDVVDALGVRDRLPPRLVLHVLLEAGVEVADDRPEADDLLAQEIDDEPKHSVRRRVVRPEVDLHHVLRALELVGEPEDRRNRVRDLGPLVERVLSAQEGRVDDRPRRAAIDGRHYSSSEKRTGSPPSG